jgi:hypothetical protein
MSNELIIPDQKQFIALCDEVDAIISENGKIVRQQIVFTKHEVGEAIAKSPLYKKFGKGNGDLIEKVAAQLGKSATDLYDCVNFYERFKSVPEELSEAPWSKVKQLVAGKIPHGGNTEQRCKKCPFHCHEANKTAEKE